MRMIVSGSALLIEYPGWRRTIPFTSVSKISLTNEYSRGNVWAVVVLEIRGGRTVKLLRCREGSLALHGAIESAWRSAGGTASLESQNDKG